MSCEKCIYREREIKELEKELCVTGFDGQYDRSALEDRFFNCYEEVRKFAREILPKLQKYPRVFGEEIVVLEHLLKAYNEMESAINSYENLLGKGTG